MLVKNKGGIVWNLSEKEAKRRIEKDGFTVVEERKVVEEVEVPEMEDGIEEARAKYSAKFGKEVSNNKKNDLEWINSKL